MHVKKVKSQSYENKRQSAAILLLVLAVMFTLCFSGCEREKANDEALGSIRKVEQPENEESEKVFDEAGNSFGYRMKTYKNPRGRMSFKMPENYQVEWISDREFSFTSPDDDKNFPGVTFFFYYDYNMDNAEDASDMMELFRDTIYQTAYLAGGQSYMLSRIKQPIFRNDYDFSDDHADILTCAETDIPKARKGSRTGSGNTELSQFDYYINWEKRPCLITCMVPYLSKEKCYKFLTYIVSHIKYYNKGITAAGYTRSLKDKIELKLFIPEEFSSVSSADNMLVYRCKSDARSAFSGMALGIYSFDKKSIKKITPGSVEQKFGDSVFRDLTEDGTGITTAFVTGREKETDIGGMTATSFDSEYIVTSSDDNYNTYYTSGDTWHMKFIKTIMGSQGELIVLNYQGSQKEEAEKVIKLLLEKSKRDSKS